MPRAKQPKKGAARRAAPRPPDATRARRLAQMVQAQYGEGAAIVMVDGGFARVREVIPTGHRVLDRWVIGVGGLPWGRIVEMFGEESSGKTTLMNTFLAAAQRDGGDAVLADAENKFDPEWAAKLGVDPGNVVQLQPPHLEGFFGQVDLLLSKNKRKMLIALDSVAALATKAEMEDALGEHDAMAELARLWSRSLRKLSRMLAEHGSTLLLLNQIRMKPGVMYGNPETTPAGKAIPFYATIRLKVMHGKTLKDGGEQGRYMSVLAMKNQAAPPHRKCALKLLYEGRFDDDWSVVEHAKEVGCLEAKKDRRHVTEAMQNLGWAPAAPEPEGDADATAQETADGQV